MSTYRLGSISQIPRGEGRAFEVGGRKIAVFHTNQGCVYATQAECPHRRGPLADGLVGGTTLICPLHERTFDLATGRALNGDCDISTFAIDRGDDGDLMVNVSNEVA